MVTPEEFIKAWQLSNSASEVAEKLKMELSEVYKRSYRYRKQGITLKKYKTGRVLLDTSKLKKLAQSLAK